MGPVIIVAAARSGTKMLRAVLSASSDLVAFPYDINYIWKYGNYHLPHDELRIEHLTDEIADFIRGRFRRLLANTNAERVVEKTVSNSLRVNFVREVFPDCKIIHLYRDGRDVAASAMLCWLAPFFASRIQPKRILLKKAVEFPFGAALPYLIEYVLNNWKQLVFRKRKVKSWGPRFDGIVEALEKHTLLEVCGIQWARSIESSMRALGKLREGREYINIRYEDVVQNPIPELDRLSKFLRIEDVTPIRSYAADNITSKYIGSCHEALSTHEVKKLLPHIDANLRRLGYDADLEKA